MYGPFDIGMYDDEIVESWKNWNFTVEDDDGVIALFVREEDAITFMEAKEEK